MTGTVKNTSRAFSLIEVLLAIFILGIGVIAIAALFPAGISQQRQSVDDIIGPIVANNALSILRMKLSQDDFGTFEEFDVLPPLACATCTRSIEGDWPWMRPGTARADIGATPEADEIGWYDIFSASAGMPPLNSTWDFDGGSPWSGSSPDLMGIPYNTQNPLYLNGTPQVTISQGSRYYPMAQADEFVAFMSVDNPKPRPQYVWDCMFRRFQGRILVAIFVYRVTVPGGGRVTYRTPDINGNRPPLPWKLLLDQNDNNAAWDAFGPDGDPRTGDEAFVSGTPSGTVYDAAILNESWQEPRQWLLDDNNNIHRVLSSTRQSVNQEVRVEFVRPITELPNLPTTYFPIGANDTDDNSLADENIVGSIFYIPAEVTPPSGSSLLLTPVYVTVKEL